jgi:hypothetical protein
MPLEITYRACLVRAHQCAIARDVSRDQIGVAIWHLNGCGYKYMGSEPITAS